MVAKPRIEYACGYWNPSTNKGNIMVFVSNYTRGVLRYQVVENSTQTKFSSIICMPIFVGVFGMKLISIGKQIGISTVNLITCASGEKCQSLTPFCTTENVIPADSKNDIDIVTFDPTIPSEITGLNNVPGSNSLTFSWNKPANLNTVAYYIEIIDPDNVAVINGFILKDRTSVTISNLNNYLIYKCNIHSITNSGIHGPDTTIYSIPIIYNTVSENNTSETNIIGKLVPYALGIAGLIVTIRYIKNRK